MLGHTWLRLAPANNNAHNIVVARPSWKTRSIFITTCEDVELDFTSFFVRDLHEMLHSIYGHV